MGRSKFVYDQMMKFYKVFQRFDDLGCIRHDESEKDTSAHMIPVNEVIRGGDSVLLPMEILRPIIERADCIFIMTECLCRRGEGCESYPAEIGCLFLGSAARELGKGMGREVTVEEAVAHAESAIELGLFPLVLHNEFDAWLWGIDYRRMLNVCFCCDCCCSVRRGVRVRQSEGFFDNIKRLPGLTVSVTDGCTGCGECVDVCIAGAISIMGGRAVINGDYCKGCGNCVAACPEDAVVMRLDDGVDTVGDILETYNKRTDVGI
jgi:UDP-glucose 4-epimerase